MASSRSFRPNPCPKADAAECDAAQVQGVIIAEEQTEGGDIPVILPQVGIPLVGDHVVALR